MKLDKLYTNKWSQEVTTDSTKVPEGTFTKSAKEIADIMASPKVSKNLGSAIKMIQFYLNRAGKNLSEERKSEIKEAEKILHERNEKSKTMSKELDYIPMGSGNKTFASSEDTKDHELDDLKEMTELFDLIEEL